MLEVPVYVITGFLESGKTTFIKEVLDSPDFADGEKTLVLLCEEGEEEYDEAQLSRHNIYIEQIDSEEDLAPEKLDILCKSNDGFVISEKDLELRGPGDLMGTRQSGDGGATVLFSGNSKLLEEVSSAVKMLRKDPAQKDTLMLLNQYALSYFTDSGHMIALN